MSEQTLKKRIGKPIMVSIAAAWLVAALGLGAITASGSGSPTARIDMKVLLLGTSSSEPDFASWQAALQREGVPFRAILTSPSHEPITAETLSDTVGEATPEAKYQAIIVSVAGLVECGTSGCASTLSQPERSALEHYEQTFHIRQITGDVFPSASYGLEAPVAGPLDGTEGTLTTEGKAVFSYLNGPVKMDTGTYGYEATPLATQESGASFDTLLEGPNHSALAGIYTHPNGVQELVETFSENQFQLQAELLRHGALNWVTHGVYLGNQRNYLGTHIDDNFLFDDSWNTTTHANNYEPAAALRETPTNVEFAAKWSQEHNFRIDMLFNGSGSAQYAERHGTDPLLAGFQKEKNAFGWVNHTWDHPNLDIGCTTQSYAEAEVNQNNSWALGTLGLTESTEPSAVYGNDNPSALVTGEFSGLANLLPGNPGTVDPPSLDTASAAASGGALAAGSYVYAVTDTFAPGGGQSIASESAPLQVAGATGSVTLAWHAVCHAAQFKIYREVAGSNNWALIATLAAPTSPPPNAWFGEPTSRTEVGLGGPLQLTFTDTGTAGTPASAPPAVNEAVESAYPQNPNLPAAFVGLGIHYFGSDASKPYPDPTIPESIVPAFPAGETFVDGSAQAVPRYPTNIYYNASTEAAEVDEYNTLYLLPADGGRCVESATTTCRTTPATFAEIVNSVDTGMFQHVMGNDPRPDYFHQTNLMGVPPPGEATSGTPPSTSPNVGDGLYYSAMNPLLAEYHKYFSSNTPIEQATMAQAGQLLAEQQAWSAASGGQVSAYIEGNQITIQNSGPTAVNVPLTGATAVGSSYGGIQSGWTRVRAGTTTRTAIAGWPTPPTVTANPANRTVIAGEGASFRAAASGSPTPSVQWQVSTDGGATFSNDTTDSGNKTNTLTLASTSLAESGWQYRALYTNALGSEASGAATLTVIALPTLLPVVTGVIPSSGSAGTVVDVIGENLTAAKAVNFGFNAAGFHVIGSTLIVAIAPKQSAKGAEAVTVTTPAGTSTIGPADVFTYLHR